jgi:hypothetical protein
MALPRLLIKENGMGAASQSGGMMEFGIVVAGPADRLSSIRAAVLEAFAKLQGQASALHCTLRYDVGSEGEAAAESPGVGDTERTALLSRVLNVDHGMVCAALASDEPDKAWAEVRKASRRVERRRSKAAVRT